MDWRENTRYAMFTRRSALISTGTLGIFAGLFARLYHLQVVKAREYATLAEENRVSVRLLAPLRGRIFDRFGVELAGNRQSYSVVIVPEQAGDPKAVLDRLIAVVPRLAAERERVLREIKRKPRLHAGDRGGKSELGGICRAQSQRARSAGRAAGCGRNARLSLRRRSRPCRGLCRQGGRDRSRGRSASHAAWLSHRQERDRADDRQVVARQGGHEPGRGQRLWPRDPRAPAARRHARQGRRVDARHGRSELRHRASARPERGRRGSRHHQWRRARLRLFAGLRSQRLQCRTDQRRVESVDTGSAEAALGQSDRGAISAGLDLQDRNRARRAHLRRHQARGQGLLHGTDLLWATTPSIAGRRKATAA